MRSILFNFEDISTGKAVSKLSQVFLRAGEKVVSAEADNKVKRSSGISFKTLSLSFADSQKIALDVKSTGDVFAVKLNGIVQPLQNPDDHYAVVKELVDAMDKGRAKFQRKMALKKVDLPSGLKSTARKIADVLQGRNVDLDAKIEQAKADIVTLKAELGDAAMDSVSPNGAWHTEKMKDMLTRSDDSLRFLMRDATEAAEIGEKMGNAKAGQYRDEAHYAGMEIVRREKLNAGGKGEKAIMNLINQTNNGKLMTKNVPIEYELTLSAMLKSGKLKKSTFLHNGDAVTAALDGVSKMNQKGYAFYVVANDKIESGWEYESDAKDHKAENMPEKLRSGAKIMKASSLKSKGLDPDDNASWMTSAMDSVVLDGLPKQENLSFSGQIEQNTIAKSGKGSAKINAEVHAWASKKFAKGNGDTVTNLSVAIEKQKIDIHTNSKAITITPFGNYLRVYRDDGKLAGSSRKSDYYLVASDKAMDSAAKPERVVLDSSAAFDAVQKRPTVFGYSINKDERGEFSADVRNESGKTVWETEGFEIFEDGFMDDKNDLGGLLKYLVDLKIAKKGDRLVKESKQDEEIKDIEKEYALDSAQCLLGSSVQPAMIDIGGKQQVQLGEVVRHAHGKSGLSVANWNDMPSDQREAAILDSIAAMKSEAQVVLDSTASPAEQQAQGLAASSQPDPVPVATLEARLSPDSDDGVRLEPPKYERTWKVGDGAVAVPVVDAVAPPTEGIKNPARTWSLTDKKTDG